MAAELEPRKLTDSQRSRFLDLITADPRMSTREALYQAGIRHTVGGPDTRVTRAQATAIIRADNDLWRDYEIARGRDLDAVEGRVFSIALDKDNAKSLDAAKFLLERLDPRFANGQKLEVTGGNGGPVRVEVEGERVTSIRDVIALAATLGVRGVAGGLSAAASRPALPAAPPVLPDPLDSQ